MPTSRVNGRSKLKPQFKPEPAQISSLLSFRAGNIDDIEAVFALNRAVFDEAWSRQSMLQSLQVGYDLFVCWDNDVLVGYVLSQDVLLEVQVMQIAVAAAYRRQGIAKTLLHMLIDDKYDYDVLMLEVRTSNVVAQHFYENLGFRQVGLRPKYYSQTPSLAAEDAVLYSFFPRGQTC